MFFVVSWNISETEWYGPFDTMEGAYEACDNVDSGWHWAIVELPFVAQRRIENAESQEG